MLLLLSQLVRTFLEILSYIVSEFVAEFMACLTNSHRELINETLSKIKRHHFEKRT